MLSDSRYIIPPPKGSAAASASILAASVAWIVGLGLPTPTGWLCVAALLPFALLAARARSDEGVHVGLVFLLTALGIKLLAVGVTALGFAVGLGVYGIILAAYPALRRSCTWFRVGSVTRDVRWLMVVTILLSGGALVAWYLCFGREVSHFQKMIPDAPLWLLPLIVLAFSMVNAAVEEAVFRGVLTQATDSVFGVGKRSLVFQGIAFGLLHIRGFPGGAIGVVMTAVYGLMLGIIRVRSRGLIAPWLTHVFADIVVVTLLLWISPK